MHEESKLWTLFGKLIIYYCAQAGRSDPGPGEAESHRQVQHRFQYFHLHPFHQSGYGSLSLFTFLLFARVPILRIHASFERIYSILPFSRLYLEVLDQMLNSLFGLHVHSCTHWLRPRTSLPPIWAHIRGRCWSAKIDDISCGPSVLDERVLRSSCKVPFLCKLGILSVRIPIRLGAYGIRKVSGYGSVLTLKVKF